jgi:hypothetical protein
MKIFYPPEEQWLYPEARFYIIYNVLVCTPVVAENQISY